MTQNDECRAPDEARAGALNDARELHRVAALVRRAAEADRHEPRLRALAGRRAALMDSIRRRLDAADGAEAACRVSAWPVEEARSFVEAIGEVAALDRQSAELLRARMESVGAELRKIRDGKRWKESNRQ